MVEFTYSVLIVEDDKAYAPHLCRCAETLGAFPVWVDELSKLRHQLAIRSFDAALVDLSLRFGDALDRQGFEAITTIQRMGDRTPIAVISGYGKFGEGSEVRDLGAKRAFTKGASESDFSEYENWMREAFGSRATIREELYLNTILLTRPALLTSEEWRKGLMRILLSPGESEVDLRRLLRVAVLDLLPVVYPSGSGVECLDSDNGSVRLNFWSRRIGAPLMVLMSKPAAFDQYQAESFAVNRVAGIDIKQKLKEDARLGDLVIQYFVTKQGFEIFNRVE